MGIKRDFMQLFGWPSVFTPTKTTFVEMWAKPLPWIVHVESPLSAAIDRPLVACVAWRFFVEPGGTSGEAAKFAREARENERRSREENKNRLPGFEGFLTAAPFTSF